MRERKFLGSNSIPPFKYPVHLLYSLHSLCSFTTVSIAIDLLPGTYHWNERIGKVIQQSSRQLSHLRPELLAMGSSSSKPSKPEEHVFTA